MHERIVVAVDFSATAHAAVRQAAFIARTTGADLHIIHIIDVFGDNPLVEIFRSAIDDVEVERRLESEAERMLREFVADIDLEGMPVRFVHARHANVVDALVNYVADVDAHLLVIGSHGRRGLKRLFLGSVAARLIRVSAVSLLVVKSSKAESISDPIDRLLVSLDLSDMSFAALQTAHVLARTFHAHMDIIHVVEPYAAPVSLTGIREIRDLVPTIIEDVRAELDALVGRLEGPYVPHRIHVVEGGAADKIVQMSLELNSDLIIMSKRGGSPLDRIVFGSTIENVSRMSEVPLYVIPVETPHADETQGSGALSEGLS